MRQELRVFGIAMLVVTALFAVSFFFPATNQICEYSKNTQHEECALYHAGPFVLQSIAIFLSGYTDLIIAMGTVVIAGFTGTLWWATSRQGDFNERALAANRRAFVFLQRINPYYIPIPEDADKPAETVKQVVSWSFRPVWENSGETHTQNLTTHIDHELRDSAIPTNFAFRENHDANGVMSLGPKAVQVGGKTREFTVSELLEVQSGKRFLYVWGWVRYNDIFPRTPRYLTRFCGQVIISGDVSKSTAVFTYPIHPVGNCADAECVAAGLG